MGIFNSVASSIMKKQVARIEYVASHPVDTQQQIFTDLIAKAKSTEWGILHDYASVRSVDDYKQRFPVQDYETLKPWIQRVMEGEQNVLWYSKVNWFAKSSGTTSDKSKFIPVSKMSLEECHYKGGRA